MPNKIPYSLEFIEQWVPKGWRQHQRGMDMNMVPYPVSNLEKMLNHIGEFDRQEGMQQYNNAKLLQQISPKSNLEDIYNAARQIYIVNQIKESEFAKAYQMNQFNMKQRRNLGIPINRNMSAEREWIM